MLRLVFMGTAPFAVPCLEAAVRTGHQVVAVVSQPDRPRGRGMKLQPSPVKSAALALGLPVWQPERASEPGFVEQLRALAPQLIVVVAYGQILRASLLELPPLGCINVHGSLLPELRGAAPIQWSILRGAAETGVTTMYMDAGMDTGDMILKAPVPIRPDDTALTLGERLAPVGADLLLRTLALIEAGTAPREPQDPARATYAPMLRKEDGAVRWQEPAVALRNRIHGCNPSPGAYAGFRGEQLKLWRAAAVPFDTAEPLPFPPGTVVATDPLDVVTGEGLLRLLEVQVPGRPRTEGPAFARGYRVEPGTRLTDG